MSGTAAAENNLSFLHCLYCLILGKQFGKGAAGKWGKYLRFHAEITKNFGNVNAVHNRGQHSDGIRLRTIDTFTGTAPHKITAADNNRNLNTLFIKLFDLSSDSRYVCFIKAKALLSGKCFAA